MNRLKKQELKNYNNSVKNMSVCNKENYDFLLKLRNDFETLVNELHVKLFSEEYDYMYDSNADANIRKKGVNPMNNEYIEKVNNKRLELGFLPLSENGYAEDSKETKEYCKKLITKDIEYISIS